jgi:hypothetical protein
MIKEPYHLGYQCRLAIMDLDENPYAVGTNDHDLWAMAWQDAAAALENDDLPEQARKPMWGGVPRFPQPT